MNKRITAFLLCVVLFSLPFCDVFAKNPSISWTEYSGTCGVSLEWTVSQITSSLSIYGNGAMDNYDSTSQLSPWFDYRGVVFNLNIADTVTSIGSYAFYDIPNLSQVFLPRSIGLVDEYAFYMCCSIRTIDLQDVRVIKKGAFSLCTSLTSVIIPSRVSYIGDEAFLGCSSLKYVVFNGEPPCDYVGNSLFQSCDENLTIYYYSENASAWAPNGETTWNGYPIAALPMVTFVDPIDNTVLSTQEIIPGESAVAPETPEHEHLVFTGWSDDFTNVFDDLTVYAEYEEECFTVTFTDGFGNTISEQQVAYGEHAEEPEIPQIEGLSFVGWDEDFSFITDDLTVNAMWETATFNVSFYDSITNEQIDEQVVEYGSAASAPEAPEHEGYEFEGWSCSFDCVTDDLIVYTVYSPATDPEPTPEPTPIPEDTVIFTVSNGQTLPGGYSTVSVSIEGEYAANGLALWVYYDPEVFSLVEMTPGALWDEMITLQAMAVSNTETEGEIGVMIIIPDQAITSSGVLFTMSFEVSDSVEMDSFIPVTLSVNEFYVLSGTQERESIPFAVINGGIEIGGLNGDVDGNGRLDSFDALLILRHALGLFTLSPERLVYADANSDGVIDSFDALIVLRKALGLIPM